MKWYTTSTYAKKSPYTTIRLDSWHDCNFVKFYIWFGIFNQGVFFDHLTEMCSRPITPLLSCSLVLLLSGSLALWLSGSLVLWLSGSLALWLSGSLVFWLFVFLAFSPTLLSSFLASFPFYRQLTALFIYIIFSILTDQNRHVQDIACLDGRVLLICIQFPGKNSRFPVVLPLLSF